MAGRSCHSTAVPPILPRFSRVRLPVPVVVYQRRAWGVCGVCGVGGCAPGGRRVPVWRSDAWCRALLWPVCLSVSLCAAVPVTAHGRHISFKPLLSPAAAEPSEVSARRWHRVHLSRGHQLRIMLPLLTLLTVQ